ncbi:MAG: DUF2085 domain-containing protein [Methanomassiliicoccales archaeon]|nr:DUF2085 domain-containing protein [Methanomassiliicoccales archaeon]
MSHPADLWAEMLWQVGYALCHQLPERSFLIGGYQLPVCARDTGTMLGFGLVLVYYLARKRWKRAGLPDVPVLMAAGIGFALFAFDGLSSYIGLRDTSNEIRLITGLGFGLSIGVMMLTVLSYVAKGSIERKTFDWKDLLLLLPTLALLYFAVTTDLGVAWYYVISTAVIVFLLLLAGTLFFILFNLLTEERPRLHKLKVTVPLTAVAVAVMLISLWFFHSATGEFIT